MSLYRIQAIEVSRFIIPHFYVFHLSGSSEPIPMAVYFWLLQSDSHLLLVDTGMGQPSGEEQMLMGCFPVKAGEDTISALAARGVKPGEIDYVILSHLHYDHCINVSLFPRAKFVIAQRGWGLVGRNPDPEIFPDPVFPRSALEWLASRKERLILAENEVELLPGLKVFWVGGHTPCSQAVAVDTAAGKALLTSDLVMHYRNLEEGIPPGIFYNLHECVQGMRRLRQCADILLPFHDPQVLERHPQGHIG